MTQSETNTAPTSTTSPEANPAPAAEAARTANTSTATQSVGGRKDRARKGRKGRTIALVGAAAVALGLGGGHMWLSATSHPQHLGEDECEQAPVTPPADASDASVADDVRDLCATIASLTDAWAEHDADSYGEAFTDDGTYTTFMGTHYEGREDIVESHRALFEGPLEGTQLADSFLSVNFVHEDVAVVSTRGDTYEGDEPEQLSKVQTYTVTRADSGDWRISSFHNTKRDGVMERLQYLMSPESKPAAERQ